jgi:hypothetical protein
MSGNRHGVQFIYLTEVFWIAKPLFDRAVSSSRSIYGGLIALSSSVHVHCSCSSVFNSDSAARIQSELLISVSPAKSRQHHSRKKKA